MSGDSRGYFFTGRGVFVVDFHFGGFRAGICFAELEGGYTCGKDENP